LNPETIVEKSVDKHGQGMYPETTLSDSSQFKSILYKNGRGLNPEKFATIAAGIQHTKNTSQRGFVDPLTPWTASNEQYDSLDLLSDFLILHFSTSNHAKFIHFIEAPP
jgi:hypothetical protein